jgi:hypothetical protein
MISLSRVAAREQQQRHVAADKHQEHQDEELDQREYDPALIRGHGNREQLGVPHHLGLQVLVRVGEFPRRALAQRREFRLRLAERRAGGEPPEDGDGGPTERRVVKHVRAERRPRFVRDREREAVRHHAHHGGVRVPDLHGSPDDRGVGREARPPQVVAEDHHRRRTGPLVLRHEGAAQQRRRRGDAEPRRGDRRDLHRAGLAVTPGEVARDVFPRPEVGHRPHRLAPDAEVVQRARLRVARLQVPVSQVHDAVALRQRQRGADEEHQHLKDDGADTDRERHCESADDRQSRILGQHPAAELEVEPQATEPREPAPVAQRLLVLLHAAEGDQRAAPRFDGLQPRFAHQALRLHLQVETELLVHARLGGGTIEQEAQARTGSFEPAHWVLG